MTGSSGVRGIFFRGAKSFFLTFSPAENSHFDRPKTNFSGKAKSKKKKKKRSPLLIVTFPPSIFNFPPSLFPFSFFYAPFSLASLFLVGQQKFPSQKSLGALCPLTPRLLRHWRDQTNQPTKIEVNNLLEWWHHTHTHTRTHTRSQTTYSFPIKLHKYYYKQWKIISNQIKINTCLSDLIRV